MKMIVLGTYGFAMGMKLAGIKDSFVITSQAELDKVQDVLPGAKLVIADAKVVEMFPELSRLENIVVLPTNKADLLDSEDLKQLTKSAVGVELNI